MLAHLRTVIGRELVECDDVCDIISLTENRPQLHGDLAGESQEVTGEVGQASL